MQNEIPTPQGRCKCGVARRDITPPVGIYHRMWGAATHEIATGVHKPLQAYGLFLASMDGNRQHSLLIITLDHCIIDGQQMEEMRLEAGKGACLPPSQVMITLTHTHGSGWMSLSRSTFPGGDLISPYFEKLLQTVNEIGQEACQTARPANLISGQGVCTLARNRDFLDSGKGNTVCGFNPEGFSDDTLLVAKIISADGMPIAALVNYACHPTTLAWENTRISPDFVGSLREIVESANKCPCLFFQGASGDLGPLEGFTGDSAIADKNGRQAGYAAAAVLESLPPPATTFSYQGQVISGATLGIWNHIPLKPEVLRTKELWTADQITVELPYKPDLPSIAETDKQHGQWVIKEKEFNAQGNLEAARDCHAMAERMTRQLTRLKAIPQGKTFPLVINLWRLGDLFWVFSPGELYQVFQLELRESLNFPLYVVTQTNDWQPGYIPAKTAYGKGIYQEEISPLAAGSLEHLIAVVREKLGKLVL
ncbi:MAG: hypothetical protein EXR99_05250 [Gemmataceae bacterium]|nr:hypothetical protein [Gemmataceae bacterium]